MAEYSSNLWSAGEIIDSTRLNNLETQFQKGSSNYGYKRYSTGNALTLFQTASTYAGYTYGISVVCSVLYFQIPNWVERSKVDFSMTFASCSSNIGVVEVGLFGGRQFSTTYGSSDLAAGWISDAQNDSIRLQQNHICSTGQTNSTTAITFTTQLWINGGESYQIVDKSTTVGKYINIYDVKMTGVESTYNPIGNTWGTIYGGFP